MGKFDVVIGLRTGDSFVVFDCGDCGVKISFNFINDWCSCVLVGGTILLMLVLWRVLVRSVRAA